MVFSKYIFNLFISFNTLTKLLNALKTNDFSFSFRSGTNKKRIREREIEKIEEKEKSLHQYR